MTPKIFFPALNNSQNATHFRIYDSCFIFLHEQDLFGWYTIIPADRKPCSQNARFLKKNAIFATAKCTLR